MPVEINYNYFAREGIKIDISSGHQIASITYTYGWRPKIVYILIAEDDNSPISKVIRYVVWGRLHSLDEADVNENVAQQIDQCLSHIPCPKPADIESLPVLLAHLHKHYAIVLSRFNNKWYSEGPSGANFRFEYRSQYNIFRENLNTIIDLCEGLTGNKNQLRHQVENAVETYRDVFQRKGKYNKYQRRWRRDSDSKWDHDYYQYHVYLDDFHNEDLANDDLRSIDFRNNLHGFLWRVAFEETDRIGRERIATCLVFQKIGETDVYSWDDDEREALVSYFDKLQDYILAYYPSLSIDMSTFIDGIIMTGLDVTPYIQHWKQAFDRVEVSRHLAGYVRSLFEQYVERGEVVFDGVPKILRRWLHEIADGDYFLKRFIEYDGVRPFATEFADASDILNVLMESGL